MRCYFFAFKITHGKHRPELDHRLKSLRTVYSIVLQVAFCTTVTDMTGTYSFKFKKKQRDIGVILFFGKVRFSGRPSLIFL